jgi:hypothetical protein
MMMESFSLEDELFSVIKNAYVFKVTFESGSSFVRPVGLDGGYEIGARMMYQMLEQTISWDRFQESKHSQTSIGGAIEKLSVVEQKPEDELCIILLIDGLQKLPHENCSKSSLLYQAITSVSNIVNKASPFVIACCAATIYVPIHQFLADSAQWRVHLFPPVIDGLELIIGEAKLFDFPDFERKILVSDMGGHGRALEILNAAFENWTENSSFVEVTCYVKENILNRYPSLKSSLLGMIPVIKAILTRQRLRRDDKVGDQFTVDQCTDFGLFRYNEKDMVLECAFILLSLLSDQKLLKDLHCCEYDPLDHTKDPERYGLVSQCWQHWEEFNARFRCLKSQLIGESRVSWSYIHAGAFFGSNCDDLVDSYPMELKILSHRGSTKSCNENKDEHCCCEPSKMEKCNGMFLCAQGNDAGDSYCCLRTDRGYVHEVHQYKHKKVVVDQESYETEFEKAASKDDFFILFTTSHASVHSLHPRCAIVDASCWQRYYGPYWARAFYIKDVNFDFPCINTSKAFRLESVCGIGKKRRLKIVDERQTNGKFKNLEDAVERLWNDNKVVPPSVLKRFRYE